MTADVPPPEAAMLYVALTVGFLAGRALLRALDEAEEMGQPPADWL